MTSSTTNINYGSTHLGLTVEELRARENAKAEKEGWLHNFVWIKLPADEVAAIHTVANLIQGELANRGANPHGTAVDEEAKKAYLRFDLPANADEAVPWPSRSFEITIEECGDGFPWEPCKKEVVQ
jgi:hypothetical protein